MLWNHASKNDVLTKIKTASAVWLSLLWRGLLKLMQSFYSYIECYLLTKISETTKLWLFYVEVESQCWL